MTTSIISGYVDSLYLGFGYSSPLTITSTGTVADHSHYQAIYESSRFSLINQGTVIEQHRGGRAGLFTNGAYIDNSGIMQSTAFGVDIFGAAGTITNSGTIETTNGSTAFSVLRVFAGTVSNSGLIATADYGIGVDIYHGGAGTVTNSGTILGGTIAARYNAGAGVYLTKGGIVTNAEGGLISGYRGVTITGGAGTVVNAGTISGVAAAVVLPSGFADRLVLDPGGTFVGKVNGGNAIGGTSTSTLELASGTGAGTFSGLGSQYINFAQVGVDLGATWTVAGVNSIVAGQTLTNDGNLYSVGTFANAGVISSAGNFTNDGLITAAHSAVTLTAGTFINNGLINAGTYGVEGDRSTGALINSGTILGAGNHGAAYLGFGGALDNLQGGTIAGSGLDGILFGGSSLVNDGVITGRRYGIFFGRGGTVTNQAQGTISGGSYAIAGYGTLINAGTLIGKYAVYIGQQYYDARLIVEPGAVFVGKIDGTDLIGSGHTSVLEFAAGTGTLAGFGTTVFDFAQITLDPGAQWLLAGSAYGFAHGESVSGFAPGNTLELTGTVESYGALSDGVLTLTGGTALYLPGVTHVSVTDDGTNTFITACFAAGTRIMGEFGLVRVETLREGDLVLTATGRLAPVRWIGHRHTDVARHPKPLDVMPVRVRAGAFGDGVPVRDLVLSPDHAVFVAGRLIPIRYLINNVSIVQEARASVTYWHVELDRHDLILAEGLACESYLDTGNRCAFANAPGAVAMTPDFARGVWAAAGCAPIVTDPADPRLRALHTSLLARGARMTGIQRPSPSTARRDRA